MNSFYSVQYDANSKAFEKACMRSKSFLIALALIESGISVEQAVRAARVEVLHQIEKWGEVEDAHDVEHEAMRGELGVCRVAVIEHHDPLEI